MELLEQVKNIETVELISYGLELSTKITTLRDTPFNTIRQLEQLQGDLELNRLYLQAVFTELSSRQLSPEEYAEMSKILYN